MSSVDHSNDSDSEKTVEDAQSIGQADSNGIDPKTETAEREAAAPASKAEFDEGLIDAAEQALGFPQAALDRLDNTPEEKKMMMMIREDPRFASLRAAVAARQAVNKPTDRLSSVAEVLGVDALKHLDAESMGRLSACSRAFGKPEPARRFSLCALAAWSRLRADKAFRRPQDGKMPNADNVQAWGSEGFRGWLSCFATGNEPSPSSGREASPLLVSFAAVAPYVIPRTPTTTAITARASTSSIRARSATGE